MPGYISLVSISFSQPSVIPYDRLTGLLTLQVLPKHHSAEKTRQRSVVSKNHRLVCEELSSRFRNRPFNVSRCQSCRRILISYQADVDCVSHPITCSFPSDALTAHWHTVPSATVCFRLWLASPPFPPIIPVFSLFPGNYHQ